MAFSFMQTISFIYLLLIRTCAASLVSHNEECHALFEFKQSISHQPYASIDVGGFQKFDSWRNIASNTSDHNFDCCLWDGVRCSNNGHVIGLDLSQSSLHGPIKSNSSLFNLLHLQMLNLSMNDFVESQIPSEIARLKQLRSLDLSSSSFSGQIPIEISHLMQLNLLDLSANPLKLQSPSLEYLLQNLTRLEELHLSGVDISSFVPPFLANISSLRSIDLEGCWLRHEFPSIIFHLPKLKYLSIAINPSLTGSLPKFQNNTLLEHLDLYATSFAGSIPKSISKLNHLVFLSLHGSYLSGCIPRSLSNMTQLTFLALGQNELMGLVPFMPRRPSNASRLEVCGKEHMHDWIGKLTNLEFLCLVRINIHGEMLPSLANLTKLSVVIIRETLIFCHMPSSFMNLTRLRVIDLQNNQVQGQISSFFSNFKSLEILHLERNDFSGILNSDRFVGLVKLKSVFLGFNRISFVDTNNHTSAALLPDLERLGLSSCNLTEFPFFLRLQKIYGEMLPSLANLTKLSVVAIRETLIFGHMPSSFMNLTRLRVIDFEHNQVQGQISSFFSNFKSLEFLNLEGNDFSGILNSDRFVGLVKLKSVYLGYNRISFVDTNNHTSAALLPDLEGLGLSSCNLTEFPFFLRLQKNLSLLFLEDNKIEGLIPEWILKNTKETLQILALSNNSITGFHGHHIFLPWVRLRAFHLEHNQLQGRLPIPPLTTIIYDVSNNNLFGEIPELICEAKSLQVLDLSSNNMTGTVPPCLGNLSNSLSVLDLNHNNFHGPVMHSFTHGCLMKWIDLGENQFTGKLSKSLANCSYLEFLNLGGNSFKDMFPSWLGTLTKLQILILRSNNFFGEIQGLATACSPFIKLRIIDLSDNGFSGHLPKNLFQTWNGMKSFDVAKSYIMETEQFILNGVFIVPYLMTLTNKGVKTTYPHILNVVTVIDLSRNNFEGHIPESLNDLLGLQSINLSHNHFTGHILPSLGNLTNLESLDLSQNELSGEIPHELLQLGFLEIFNVSFNHLHGAIPHGKQLDTFDKYSYMGNLGLCGAPLSKKCQTSMTRTLTSANNEYESLLPSDIIDWIIVFLGVGCGLVIGVVLGNLLCVRYGDWLIESIGMRNNNRWVRPLRNTRRN